VIRATPEVVADAVRLCGDNARRLVENATILLENGGSDGLAYVLWSIAVEEFGKGILLAQQASGAKANCIEITPCSDHDKKFAAGFERLTSLHGTRLGTFLRVTTNTTDATSVVKNPFLPESTVSVASGQTGRFSDGLDEIVGIDPTIELRFALIYVDWNANEKRWMRPGQTLRHGDFVARWELSRDDLRTAIVALNNEVASPPNYY